MHVQFWGTRGSIATPGIHTVRYGGNTSCVLLETHHGTLFVLDCGTGARLLGDHLMERRNGPIRGHMLLTHTHWDHIQGFPFFEPAFRAHNEWIIYGPTEGEDHLEQALSGQMAYAYFPVELDELGSQLHFASVGEEVLQMHDVTVRTHYLNHPGVALGYRIESGGVTVVYCTDHEPFAPALFRPGDAPSLDAIIHPQDRAHAEFMRGADLVIHDAQYTAREYERRLTWGHSSVEYVVELALLVGVERLALYHHDPAHDDVTLDQLERETREMVKQRDSQLDVFYAREGASLELTEVVTDRVATTPHLRPSTHASSARVLVVEEDTRIREMIAAIVAADRHVVDTAADPRGADESIADAVPDVIVLGVTEPADGSRDFLARIRGSHSTACVPVILLAPADDTQAEEWGFAAGADDLIRRPFSAAQLRSRITQWLDRNDERQSGIG